MAKKKGTFKWKGMNKLMKNLNKEINAIEGRTMAGLISAVIHIRRQSEPLVPVDLGNLRASWFTVTTTGETIASAPSFRGDNASMLQLNHGQVIGAVQSNLPKRKRQPIIGFGFTANYAGFVHEMVDANFRREGAEARFLYKTIKKERSKILDKIHEKAKI